jgi:hypothetical protein
MACRLAALVLLAATGLARAESPAPCQGRDRILVLRIAERRLQACEAGRAAASFHVAIGRAGAGKHDEGDDRTPVGTYALGAPRASAEFHTFIPVGYPSEAQRRQGYSGGAIGVHGPPRKWAWLGALSSLADWTRGCIAVSSDAEIGALARWVRRGHVERIIIE